MRSFPKSSCEIVFVSDVNIACPHVRYSFGKLFLVLSATQRLSSTQACKDVLLSISGGACRDVDYSAGASPTPFFLGSSALGRGSALCKGFVETFSLGD